MRWAVGVVWISTSSGIETGSHNVAFLQIDIFLDAFSEDWPEVVDVTSDLHEKDSHYQNCFDCY